MVVLNEQEEKRVSDDLQPCCCDVCGDGTDSPNDGRTSHTGERCVYCGAKECGEEHGVGSVRRSPGMSDKCPRRMRRDTRCRRRERRGLLGWQLGSRHRHRRLPEWPRGRDGRRRKPGEGPRAERMLSSSPATLSRPRLNAVSMGQYESEMQLGLDRPPRAGGGSEPQRNRRASSWLCV